jgi:hypothetical protein
MDHRQLLTNAQRYAIDPDKPVSAALRQLVVLGSVPELAEIREWVLRELNGYKCDEIAIPEYRTVRTEMRGKTFDGSCDVPLEVQVLDKVPSAEHAQILATLAELVLRESVDELEAMLEEGRRLGRIERTIPSGVLPWLWANGSIYKCIMAQQIVKPSALIGVLGRIRTTVVDFTSAALASCPVGSDENAAEPQGRGATTTILQSFHGCQIGAMAVPVTHATNSTVRASGGNATNEGVVGIQNNHPDSLGLETVAGELRVLVGAFTVLSNGTSDSLASLLQAITNFEAKAGEEGQKTHKKVDEVMAMLDPIWEEFMRESFKTWAQKAVEQGGGKVIGALPGLVKIMGGAP